jgi:GT2 family glycosyltransferase
MGYFDERFAPHDMEDVDLSTKAKKLGIDLCTYPSEYVSHIGAQTIQYGSEREQVTLENKKKFYEKWVA